MSHFTRDAPSNPPRRLAVDSLDRAAAVHDVLIAAYRVEAERLGVEDFPPLRRTIDQVASSPRDFFAVEIDGRLAALAEVDPHSEPIDLAALVVHPDYFRRGLGRQLTRFVLQQHAGRRVSVSTGTKNEPAIRLYRSLGFEEIERWERPDGIPMTSLEHPNDRP